MTTEFQSSCAADLAALVADRIPATHRVIADAAIAAARRGDTTPDFAIRCSQAGVELGDAGQPAAACAMFAAANASQLAWVGPSARQIVLDALKANLAGAGL